MPEKSTTRLVPAIPAATQCVTALGGIIDPDDRQDSEKFFSTNLEFDLKGAMVTYEGIFKTRKEHGKMTLRLTAFIPLVNPVIEKEFYILLNALNSILPDGTFLFDEEGSPEVPSSSLSHLSSVPLRDGKVVEADVEENLLNGRKFMDAYLPAIVNFLTTNPRIRITSTGRVTHTAPGMSIMEAVESVAQGRHGHA